LTFHDGVNIADAHILARSSLDPGRDLIERLSHGDGADADAQHIDSWQIAHQVSRLALLDESSNDMCLTSVKILAWIKLIREPQEASF
jgi:hypothetical protein